MLSSIKCGNKRFSCKIAHWKNWQAEHIVTCDPLLLQQMNDKECAKFSFTALTWLRTKKTVRDGDDRGSIYFWCLELAPTVQARLTIQVRKDLHSSEERSPKRRKEEKLLLGPRSDPDDDQDAIESPYLPESLLEEIIVRLPVKSIFRLKCICKSWLFRLSEPSFAHKYQSVKKNFTSSWTLLNRVVYKQGKNLEQKRSCSLSSNGFISPTTSVLYLPSPYVNKILASSNGLLLCDHRQGLYYICNPFTQQMISVPQPVTWVDYQVEGLITRMDEHGVVIKSYKVVQVRLSDYAKPCFLDVFCSKSGAWATYKLYTPYNPTYRKQFPFVSSFPPISLKETLYIPDYGEEIIMAYSPYADPCKLQLIYLPDRNDGQPRFRRRRMCGSCRGRLRYYSTNLVDRHLIQKVWELVDDKEGEWCLVYSNFSGSDNDVWLSQSLSSEEFWPICFDPFDNDLVYFRKGGCIHSYHLAKRKSKLLHGLERHFAARRPWNTVIPYEHQTWPTPIPPPTWTTGET